MVSKATEHTLRALGVARPLDIRQYFLRGKYTGLAGVLRTLTEQGRVVPVRVDGGGPPSETWYVHAEALGELEAIRAGHWQGRTFAFRNEMYIPKAKRQYGYYLLPILHGDRLVGRAAPRFDRGRGVLRIEGLYLETDIKPTAVLCRAVTGQLDDLAALIGATGIEYGDTVPERWRPTLHPS